MPADFDQESKALAVEGSERNENLFRASDSSSMESGVMEEYSEKPPPPPRRRFYKQKKYWIICSIITAIIVVVVVCLIIFVFFPMIAQSLMNQAGIDVEGAQITFNPPDNLQKRDNLNMNTSFYMHMESKMSNTGPFAASLKFHNPINVYYNETLLGNITLPDGSISGGSGTLVADTPFMIQDTDYFAAFAKEMLAAEKFYWKLKGKLDITALSRTATVDLDKDVAIPGMNGFPNVTIQSFHLPSDDPNGGIKVELGTRMVSPSPVGVQLGTISLRIGYDGVNLGMVSAENITLKEGDNDILLKGTLVPQTDPAALEKVGVLFSNYVSGKMSQTTATGVSAAPDGHNPITWLSEGFQSVQLNVGLGNSQPLDIIKTVEMGYLDLAFSQEAPYSPVMSAPNVVAGFQIPFGFSLNIYEVQQNLKMATNESGEFATITTQWLPSHCDQAAGRLSFAMSNDNIIAIQGKEKEFDDYTYSLTASDLYSFQVGGSATTKTQTPIGNITLGGITFNVPTSLHGMQFLNSTPTIINSLDVTGGQTDYMELSINVTMGNPSDFSIATGDVHLNMLASGVKLGTVLLYNLTLQRGSNTVIALGTFDPKSSPVGQNLLSTFVMGQDNTVDISGFDQSTAIASLKKGLADIRIESTLPGLKSPLIQSSALTVLPDTLQTNVVNVQVSIANPFSAGLSITSVKSAITFQGMPVGNIDQDISNSPINIPGHSTVLSSPLNMQMNLEPAAVALLLRQLVVKSNMDTRPYDALLNMGGFQIAGMEQISADPSLFDNFNISSYVMQAMKALAVDLQLASGLTIGQYTNTLQFSQNNVSTSTDETVTRLIPVVGQPIVQQIVDGSKLGFDSIVLSEPTDQGFKVQMVGSISNTGPMAASISFPAPLTVAWQGRELGKVSMAAINTQPNVGAQFNVSGEFSITDQDYMGQFSAYMINNEDFVWNIYTNSVDVTAIGYTFTNISMNKFVTLGGAKGFQNCVTINSFNLPANDPQGGIQLIANTTIQNPSQIGFVLNGAGFESYFDNVLLGPLASNGMASFPPRGTSSMQMVGRLIKQNSEDGIDAITAVFTNYLNAQDSQLTVKGASGSGPNGQVGWLTTGFQSISIPNVTLPGPDKKPELIPSITMRDMELDFTKDPYAPPASSKHVEAQIKNPFGFPLGVSQVNMGVKASYDGNDVAELKVPDEPATTDNNGLMVTQFENLPFSVYDNAHAIFDAFVKALTSSSNVTFGLSGAANSVADTAVGSLKLNNITFDVQSTLAGFNNFNGQTTIIKQSVTGGTPDYIEVTLTVSFTNPSNITISIGDLTFDTIMDEHQTSVGKVMMKDVHIVPGNNTFDATMHMQNPSHKDYVDQMVSIYMTNAQAPLTIAGSADSSSIASLKDGLSTVRLATTMQGINSHLIEKAEVQARVAVIVTKKASTWVTLNNPLETAYTVKRVQVDITNENDGKPYKMGTIDYELPNPLTVPAGSQVRSDEWPVHVEADLGELLGLVGKGEIQLSLQQNVTVQVGETDGGYSSYFYYYQDHVPCSMDIQLLGISLPTTDDGDDNSSSNSTVASASSAIASAGDTVESGASKLLSGPTSTSEADKAQETASSSSSSSSSSDSSDSSSSSPSSTSSASESSDNDKPHFLWPLKV